MVCVECKGHVRNYCQNFARKSVSLDLGIDGVNIKIDLTDIWLSSVGWDHLAHTNVQLVKMAISL
jgi:hypothetical protein